MHSFLFIGRDLFQSCTYSASFHTDFSCILTIQYCVSADIDTKEEKKGRPLINSFRGVKEDVDMKTNARYSAWLSYAVCLCLLLTLLQPAGGAVFKVTEYFLTHD